MLHTCNAMEEGQGCLLWAGFIASPVDLTSSIYSALRCLQPSPHLHTDPALVAHRAVTQRMLCACKPVHDMHCIGDQLLCCSDASFMNLCRAKKPSKCAGSALHGVPGWLCLPHKVRHVPMLRQALPEPVVLMQTQGAVPAWYM